MVGVSFALLLNVGSGDGSGHAWTYLSRKGQELTTMSLFKWSTQYAWDHHPLVVERLYLHID